MAYTDIGSGGRIYDVNEGGRLIDALNQTDLAFKGIDATTDKNKNIIRYAIVIGGSVLILALFSIVVKKKK
jgi:hypothetical protein